MILIKCGSLKKNQCKEGRKYTRTKLSIDLNLRRHHGANGLRASKMISSAYLAF